MSFPCIVSRDEARHAYAVGQEDLRREAIERAIGEFVNLSVQTFWERLPDQGRNSLSERMADILNEYAEHLIATDKRDNFIEPDWVDTYF